MSKQARWIEELSNIKDGKLYLFNHLYVGNRRNNYTEEKHESLLEAVTNRLVDDYGFDSEVAGNFYLALDEIIRNAIKQNKKYGVKGPSAVAEIYIDGSYMAFVRSEGTFDPKQVPAPFTKEGKPKIDDHGKGMFIARSYTHKFMYLLTRQNKVGQTEAFLRIDLDGKYKSRKKIISEPVKVLELP
jgi:anti-sigma regulatory factor (Ser/Thr protein kinase)